MKRSLRQMDVANAFKEGDVARRQNTQGITVEVQVEREMGASAAVGIERKRWLCVVFGRLT